MFLKCPYLSDFSTLNHAFFMYDPEMKDEQRVEILAGQAIPLATLKQVHGNKVLIVTEESRGENADALVTNVKGLAIGIFTADCGPVLFYDPIANVIGAAHAGWRGARAGIIQNTVKAMEDIGAKRSQICATLGPTIFQENYEVGPEFPDLIGDEYDTYFQKSQKKDHHYFNLPKYVMDLIEKENLSKSHNLNTNTFIGSFISARRILAEGRVHKKENNFSVIAIV